MLQEDFQHGGIDFGHLEIDRLPVQRENQRFRHYLVNKNECRIRLGSLAIASDGLLLKTIGELNSTDDRLF